MSLPDDNVSAHTRLAVSVPFTAAFACESVVFARENIKRALPIIAA
jgi:hypothetical protein